MVKIFNFRCGQNLVRMSGYHELDHFELPLSASYLYHSSVLGSQLSTYHGMDKIISSVTVTWVTLFWSNRIICMYCVLPFCFIINPLDLVYENQSASNSTGTEWLWSIHINRKKKLKKVTFYDSCWPHLWWQKMKH